MRRSLAFLVLAALSCSRGDAQPVQTTTTGLEHHEIRADRMPPPFASASAANSPFVRKRPAGAQLHLPAGFSIAVYASDVDDPRNMIVAPNGDVIVAETGANRVSILRDASHNGTAVKRFTYTKNVDGPFGLAIQGPWLYVAGETEVVRFPYRAGDTAASGQAQRLATLPGGGHSTRNLVFSHDGRKYYVAIGSSSNVSREGPPRAAIMEYDAVTNAPVVFASGLRNPVGLSWNPANGTLWTAVNERDGLGDDLVPDYITEVRRDTFYGWPYAYIGGHEDPRRKGERPDLVAKAVVPSLLIASHSAPLGLTFYSGSMFPSRYRGGVFVALHGSWNRAMRTGYKVIFVPFRNGQPAGGYDDFVTGWLEHETDSSVWGRPVGVTVLGDGSLLVADDGANLIWRVTYRK